MVSLGALRASFVLDWLFSQFTEWRAGKETGTGKSPEVVFEESKKEETPPIEQ